jgi:hypothetical protein
MMRVVTEVRAMDHSRMTEYECEQLADDSLRAGSAPPPECIQEEALKLARAWDQSHGATDNKTAQAAARGCYLHLGFRELRSARKLSGQLTWEPKWASEILIQDLPSIVRGLGLVRDLGLEPSDVQHETELAILEAVQRDTPPASISEMLKRGNEGRFEELARMYRQALRTTAYHEALRLHKGRDRILAGALSMDGPLGAGQDAAGRTRRPLSESLADPEPLPDDSEWVAAARELLVPFLLRVTGSTPAAPYRGRITRAAYPNPDTFGKNRTLALQKVTAALLLWRPQMLSLLDLHPDARRRTEALLQCAHRTLARERGEVSLDFRAAQREIVGRLRPLINEFVAELDPPGRRL